jgi:hypothetical protein
MAMYPSNTLLLPKELIRGVHHFERRSIISRATPKRDYYCKSRRGNRLFELGLGEVALALTTASSKSDQAAIAVALATAGRENFNESGLHAELLSLDQRRDQQLADDRRRAPAWQDSLSAFQHALPLGAGALQNLPNTQAQTGSLISASQSSVGIL